MPAYWLSLHDTTDRSAWRPLERLAAVVAARPGLPPVDPDDFIYCARVTRKDMPVLHVYRNVLTNRYLNVDEACLLWRYIGPGANRGDPRYALIEDLGEALTLAELTRAEHLAGRTRRGRRGTAPSPAASPAGPPPPATAAVAPRGPERPWGPRIVEEPKSDEESRFDEPPGFDEDPESDDDSGFDEDAESDDDSGSDGGPHGEPEVAPGGGDAEAGGAGAGEGASHAGVMAATA